MEKILTIVRSKTSTFRLFEVTFLLEKWKLVCLISTFRVPRRSKSGWRKQDSVGLAIKRLCYFQSDRLLENTMTKNRSTPPNVMNPFLVDNWNGKKLFRLIFQSQYGLMKL